jgi:hypothetical protein
MAQEEPDVPQEELTRLQWFEDLERRTREREEAREEERRQALHELDQRIQLRPTPSVSDPD